MSTTSRVPPLPHDSHTIGRDDHAASRQLWQARLLVLVSAILWSTSGFFAKAPYFHGWQGATLAFWRAVFACLVLWPFVRRAQWSWKLVPMAAMFAAMNYTYLTAMEKGSAANAIWLQCTAPVWVLLIGVLVFHERAGRRDWLLIAFVSAGVGFILYFESRGQALEAVGWALLSGVFYAGVVLSLRQLRSLDAVWLAAVNLTATAIALAPLAYHDSRVPSGIQWPFLAAFGILQMGLPYVLFANGLKRIPGHEAAGIGMIEPILMPIWVYLAWGEPPAWWTLIGAILILVGLTIRYFKPTPRPLEPVGEVPVIGGP